jgi:hypothetical protein
MSGAALVERPLQEDKITRTAEFEADLSKMRDADKAETLVDGGAANHRARSWITRRFLGKPLT